MKDESHKKCKYNKLAEGCGCSDVSESVEFAGHKVELVRHAATLLNERLSDFEEDYPKRFSKKVLREIQQHNELLRVLAVDIARIGRAL